MFNRESILKNLNTENYYIDKHSLDLFLSDWRIESIYEDESGLEGLPRQKGLGTQSSRHSYPS